MCGGSCCRRHREKGKEARSAKAARNRRTESEQPDRIEAEMHEIGVNESVGNEGPDLGRKPARHRTDQKRRVVACRDEREQQDEFEFGSWRQHEYADEMDHE